MHEFFSFNFPLSEYFPVSFLMVRPLCRNIVPGWLWVSFISAANEVNCVVS